MHDRSIVIRASKGFRVSVFLEVTHSPPVFNILKQNGHILIPIRTRMLMVVSHSMHKLMLDSPWKYSRNISQVRARCIWKKKWLILLPCRTLSQTAPSKIELLWASSFTYEWWATTIASPIHNLNIVALIWTFNKFERSSPPLKLIQSTCDAAPLAATKAWVNGVWNNDPARAPVLPT